MDPTVHRLEHPGARIRPTDRAPLLPRGSTPLRLHPARLHLSVFQTREDPQPTSEFVAVCPCPDGLMQDGTQEGG
jgi:hypothetical protein